MKSFMKFMFMAASAMTVMLFTSCDKDDDGGSALLRTPSSTRIMSMPASRSTRTS